MEVERVLLARQLVRVKVRPSNATLAVLSQVVKVGGAGFLVAFDLPAQLKVCLRERLAIRPLQVIAERVG